MGNIDKSRFAGAIEQLRDTYEYKTHLYFTDAFLPSGGFKEVDTPHSHS